MFGLGDMVAIDLAVKIIAKVAIENQVQSTLGASLQLTASGAMTIDLTTFFPGMIFKFLAAGSGFLVPGGDLVYGFAMKGPDIPIPGFTIFGPYMGVASGDIEISFNDEDDSSIELGEGITFMFQQPLPDMFAWLTCTPDEDGKCVPEAIIGTLNVPKWNNIIGSLAVPVPGPPIKLNLLEPDKGDVFGLNQFEVMCAGFEPVGSELTRRKRLLHITYYLLLLTHVAEASPIEP